MRQIEIMKFYTVQAVMACTDEGLLDLVNRLLVHEMEGGAVA